MRNNKPGPVLLVLTAIVLTGGCSNFLTDPQIYPDQERVSIFGTLTTSMEKNTTSKQGSVSVNIEWADAVSSFTSSDVQPSNASVGDFTGSGTSWSFTVQALSAGDAGFEIPAGAAVNSKGHTTEALSFTYTWAPDALNLVISTTAQDPTNLSSIPLNFTFTKAVDGFGSDDIQIEGGATISSFSRSGTSYDTYTANLDFTNDNTVQIRVNAGACTIMNTEEPNTSADFSIRYDKTPPEPPTVHFTDTTVNSTNVTNYGFTMVGESGSTYSYTITSTNGGTGVSGSGTFDDGTNDDADESATEYITGLDLSGLADGYLILEITVIDQANNSSTEVQVVEKASVTPETGTADFSAESAAVSFDICYHETQTVPSGPVKYDTTSVIGSTYDDTIKFSELEDGETFTADGGDGFNTLDLGNYASYDVTVYAGYDGTNINVPGTEDAGIIIVDLGNSESATINYSNFSYVNFSSNNFTGSPHAIHMDTADSTAWCFNNLNTEVYSGAGNCKVALLYFEGTLGLNYELDTTFTPIDDHTSSYNNGIIVFDYQDADNYKYIRAYVNMDLWTIGEVINGNDDSTTSDYSTLLAYFTENIEIAENSLALKITGTEGKTAELWSDGAKKTEYTFDDVLNDGLFGITNAEAHTSFSIDMQPSNWAPYVKDYDVRLSQSGSTEKTLDLTGDAVDNEGDSLSIVSISDGTGTLTNNGDGTVTYEVSGPTFYGTDEFTYVISDGTSETEGTICFDVVP